MGLAIYSCNIEIKSFTVREEPMKKTVILLFMLLPVLSMGSDKPDILLGQVVSVSSPLVGDISSELKSGYDAFFSELNDRGGINGRKVKLIQKEDGYNATKTLALTRELITDDKVIALVGYLGTPGPSLVVKENLLISNNIAMVGPSTGVATLLAEKNIFPIRATYEAELAEIVAHAKAMQHKRIAFVTWSAGAGPILSAAFPKIVADAGLELVYQKEFRPLSDPKEMAGVLDGVIAPLEKIKPDAVLLIAGGEALYEAIGRLRSKLPSTLPLYTISSVNWQDLIKSLGLKTAKGIVISQAVPYPYSPQLPIVKQYLECMRRASKAPNYYSFEGYLGAAITAEALRRAGTVPTRSSVVAALQGMGRYRLAGFEVNYTEKARNGFRKPETTLITSRGALLR
jgi:branched-chain amino acid transport system substrate-binding protein